LLNNYNSLQEDPVGSRWLLSCLFSGIQTSVYYIVMNSKMSVTEVKLSVVMP